MSTEWNQSLSQNMILRWLRQHLSFEFGIWFPSFHNLEQNKNQKPSRSPKHNQQNKDPHCTLGNPYSTPNMFPHLFQQQLYFDFEFDFHLFRIGSQNTRHKPTKSPKRNLQGKEGHYSLENHYLTQGMLLHLIQ